ncbi:MAG: hypothetical protein IID35_11875, partial [Planctomycetes bacterium]|nr:hypothetical protein [Planctomycetota bacterium]
GQRSTICDVNCVRAELDINGTDWGVCSYDASLIGVVAKILEFSGPVTGRRAMSGRSLVGAGTQNAEILYDIIAPPGELRDEAYEDLGGILSDAPVRIGSPKKIAGRATVRH